MREALGFFGAFNPPTVAHLAVAEQAMQVLGLDCVVFVPSQGRFIVHNQQKGFAYDNDTRLHMLRTLAQTRPWMQVCQWELSQPVQPKTYTTLCHLRDQGIHAALLVGSDKLHELDGGWMYVPQIAREFGIVVMNRGGDDARQMIDASEYLTGLAGGIRVIDPPPGTRHVSSTLARAGQVDLVPAEIRHMLLTEEDNAT